MRKKIDSRKYRKVEGINELEVGMKYLMVILSLSFAVGGGD